MLPRLGSPAGKTSTGDDSPCFTFEKETELVGGQGQGKVQLTRRCAIRLPRGFSPDPENQGYAREGQERAVTRTWDFLGEITCGNHAPLVTIPSTIHHGYTHPLPGRR